jgi:phosphoribosylglycinamide formyltransferase 1
MEKKKIAIFASGSGTNAEKIMSCFKDHSEGKVVLILSNKADAFVLERAKKFNIPVHVFDRPSFRESTKVLNILQEREVSLLVLAGFLWLVPEYLIRAYPQRIVNIHPALLPAYGGKGMYGRHVHEAVIHNGEKESGISIHFVNEKYDEGAIILQAKCEVLPDDTPESLAERIHLLEHKHYPEVIEKIIREMN